LDNEKVTGVIYYDKNGQNLITTRVLIDCSGYGYTAAKAGVPFEIGDEAHGQMMAVSLTFFMVNVEVDKIEEYKVCALCGAANLRWRPGFRSCIVTGLFLPPTRGPDCFNAMAIGIRRMTFKAYGLQGFTVNFRPVMAATQIFAPCSIGVCPSAIPACQRSP
jgi:FAD dependent oxidoreductase